MNESSRECKIASSYRDVAGGEAFEFGSLIPVSTLGSHEQAVVRPTD